MVDTLFHSGRFGFRKAFFIRFEISTTTKSLSASYTAIRYSIDENMARLLMHKVREAIRSDGGHTMDGRVQMDEFGVGGKEGDWPGRSYDSKKKKVVGAVQLTDESKVIRLYSLKITDFSSKSLIGIFNRHINKAAKVTADEWRGYRPIAKDYRIKQAPSNATELQGTPYDYPSD